MSFKSNFIAVALAAVSLMNSSVVQADIGCPMNIDAVSLNTEGYLNVSVSNGATTRWWYMCSC